MGPQLRIFKKVLEFVRQTNNIHRRQFDKEIVFDLVARLYCLLVRKILHGHRSKANFSHTSKVVARMVSTAQHFLEHQGRCLRLDYLRRLLNHHTSLRHQHVSDKSLCVKRENVASCANNIDDLLKGNCITHVIVNYLS